MSGNIIFSGPATVSSVSVYNITKDGFTVEFSEVILVPSIALYYVLMYNGNIFNASSNDVFIPVEDPTATTYNISVAYRTTKTSSFSNEISSSMLKLITFLDEVKECLNRQDKFEQYSFKVY